MGLSEEEKDELDRLQLEKLRREEQKFANDIHAQDLAQSRFERNWNGLMHTVVHSPPEMLQEDGYYGYLKELLSYEQFEALKILSEQNAARMARNAARRAKWGFLYKMWEFLCEICRPFDTHSDLASCIGCFLLIVLPLPVLLGILWIMDNLNLI